MYASILLTTIALMNLITFIVYGIDKFKARRGKWRIPESTLLLLAMLEAASVHGLA